MKFVSADLYFEPRDLWLGVYWDIPKAQIGGTRYLLVYFCALPTLCLKVRFRFSQPQK